MGFITNCVRFVFGLRERNINTGASSERLEAGKRKRPDEEEEEEDNFEASASVSSKNSLHTLPPFKRVKMDPSISSINSNTDPEVKSPIRKIASAIRSFFSSEPKTLKVQASEVTAVNQAEVVDQDALKSIETIDLADEDDGQIESPPETAPSSISSVPPPSSVPSSSTSFTSLATLATFGGFTGRTFPDNVSDKDIVSTKPGPGHVITTQHEKQRRAQASSPEAVKTQFRSGFQSRHDKYFTEKDIARRVWNGGISKQSKSGSKQSKSNGFKFTSNLIERERYRNMLEKFGVIKYSSLTKRTEIVKKSSPRSSDKPAPIVANVDIIGGSVVDSKTLEKSNKNLITSTAIKHSDHLFNIDIAASPVLGRDKISSLKTPEKSKKSAKVLGDDDEELSAAIEEVTSPKYLEKLYSKYGAVTRDREKQIERELNRKERCEKETEEVFSMIDKRLETHLKITQAVVDESTTKDSEFDESQPTDLPNLTPDMQAAIRKAQCSRGETLIDAHKIQITVKDIDTLAGLNWLNDEIINFYMQMIVARAEGDKKKYRSVYSFSTFFYPRLMDAGYSSVKRWTKKVDLFSYSLVLVPVHLGMHWCLATIDMESQSIVYYDSMGGNNKGALRGLSNYLLEEHKTKKGSDLDMSGWKQIIAKKIPQQMNGSDCGMFTCKFAEYCSRRARFTFNQSHMPYFRKRMVYEIVKNKLLSP